MVTRISVMLATILTTSGIIFAAPVTAAPNAVPNSAHGAADNAGTGMLQTDAAAAWTSTEFIGTRLGVPNEIIVCGTLAHRVHSAALVDTIRTVTLYSTTHCAGAIVAVLHAGNEADSGTMAGTPTTLGILGAQAYTVT